MVKLMSKSAGCETHEMVDRYIQHSLKNWAAEQHPPAYVKARLLLQASSHQPKLDRMLQKTKVKVSLLRQQPPSAEFFLNPMDQSYAWFIRISMVPLQRLS
jgi:hypothetical protein